MIIRTVDKNIIGAPKMNFFSFFYIAKLNIFQYCDSNMEHFSIAFKLVITLPTLREQNMSLFS